MNKAEKLIKLQKYISENDGGLVPPVKNKIPAPNFSKGSVSSGYYVPKNIAPKIVMNEHTKQKKVRKFARFYDKFRFAVLVSSAASSAVTKPSPYPS